MAGGVLDADGERRALAGEDLDGLDAELRGVAEHGLGVRHRGVEGRVAAELGELALEHLGDEDVAAHHPVDVDLAQLHAGLVRGVALLGLEVAALAGLALGREGRGLPLGVGALDREVLELGVRDLVADPAQLALLEEGLEDHVVWSGLALVGARLVEAVEDRVHCVADQRAALGLLHAVAHVAGDALEVVGLEQRVARLVPDVAGLTAALEPAGGGVAAQAELADARDVLVGDGDPRQEERVTHGVGHQRPLPRIHGGVFVPAVADFAVLGRLEGVADQLTGLGRTGGILCDGLTVQTEHQKTEVEHGVVLHDSPP